ncbi:hypothetical protein [Streptomyces sp. NPDC054849]
MTDTATIALRIENFYVADGVEIETTAIVTVPLPLPEEDTDERMEWEYEHIFPATGTGRSGDAVYDVEVSESTAPELRGLTFEFGY